MKVSKLKELMFVNIYHLSLRITILYVLICPQVIPALSLIARNLTDASTDLKNILTAKVPKEQERVKEFRKNFGSTKVGEVTVDMVCIFTVFF